jgi:hypothetical protein
MVTYLVYFVPFWYVEARKIWQPWLVVDRMEILSLQLDVGDAANIYTC